MNIEKHRAFIESLEGEKGLPEEMHGWRLDMPLDLLLSNLAFLQIGLMEKGQKNAASIVDYLANRLHHAESRQIPDLKEKVKELLRDAMDVAGKAGYNHNDYRIYEAFRALCAEVKS